MCFTLLPKKLHYVNRFWFGLSSFFMLLIVFKFLDVNKNKIILRFKSILGRWSFFHYLFRNIFSMISLTLILFLRSFCTGTIIFFCLPSLDFLYIYKSRLCLWFWLNSIYECGSRSSFFSCFGFFNLSFFLCLFRFLYSTCLCGCSSLRSLFFSYLLQSSILSDQAMGFFNRDIFSLSSCWSMKLSYTSFNCSLFSSFSLSGRSLFCFFPCSFCSCFCFLSLLFNTSSFGLLSGDTLLFCLDLGETFSLFSLFFLLLLLFNSGCF